MENVAVPKLKSVAWDTVENNKVKGVRELRSQRSKRTELIPVFLTWSMPRNIATPPLDGMLVHRRVTPPAVCRRYPCNYTPWWRETKWSKVPWLRKQRDGRGLYPGPPNMEFEVLTARPHTSQGHPTTIFGGISVRKTIWNLEFSKHLL